MSLHIIKYLLGDTLLSHTGISQSGYPRTLKIYWSKSSEKRSHNNLSVFIEIFCSYTIELKIMQRVSGGFKKNHSRVSLPVIGSVWLMACAGNHRTGTLRFDSYAPTLIKRRRLARFWSSTSALHTPLTHIEYYDKPHLHWPLLMVSPGQTAD